MQIEPQNTIPLIYQITDPSDSTIYYIRAVVYDSLTREVLSTQNLVSRGSGLWTSTALAPADSTGLGRHIHVIIKVYTDSGYTTLSDNYNQQIDKYLVKTSNRFGGGSGGGSGQDIDYNKIGKLVETIIANKIATIKSEPIDLSNITSTLNKIIESIDAIKIPEPTKPLDLSSIIEGLKDLKSTITQKIDDKEIPQPFDYSKLFDGIDIDLKGLALRIQDINDLVTNIKQSIGVPEKVMNELKTLRELSTSFVKSINDKSNKLQEISSAFSESDSPEKDDADEEKAKVINKYFNA